MLNKKATFQRAHGNINVKINNNEINHFYQSGSAKVFYPKSSQKFKELVNESHKRGIAVILDVVYNHATGQNSYFRMWNTNSDAYDGTPTSQNPFFQVSPVSESYLNYFNDFNHESSYVKDYMKRINHYLIEEYHIDGFRFDLTKGMTNEVIAENYSTKRINYLKSIADDIWDYDPSIWF